MLAFWALNLCHQCRIVRNPIPHDNASAWPRHSHNFLRHVERLWREHRTEDADNEIEAVVLQVAQIRTCACSPSDIVGHVTPRDPRRRRRLFWWWFGGISFVLIAGLLIVRLVLFNDKATPLTTDAALERYRSSTVAATTTTVAPETQTLPLTGVYRYTTVGRESIDALDGAEHVYPDETTITFASVGCGVEMRWDALLERRDIWNLCVTEAGIELQPNGDAYHVFFEQEEIEPIECDRSVVLIPASANDAPATSDPVPLACTIGGDPWLPVWQVLERGVRTVEGVSVEVQHVRMTVTDEDEFHEHITLDWYLDENGLLIAAELTKKTLADTILGGVTYKESYTLDLVSLTPLR